MLYMHTSRQYHYCLGSIDSVGSGVAIPGLFTGIEQINMQLRGKPDSPKSVVIRSLVIATSMAS